ncbi:hypothetical protein [Nostoc sp. ChiSLP03a]|uniref:hypothetical protein n=1 Tax=Nostoc sp. ChiSLP03a TaxID=3075380 RepID=UPI002AD5399F|nr:hypothetical protein [Nostoc sp. ChiSLP03a]MDZ8214518.1 hypothetical protein [Nostoc sp. ChiSLP03a]
MLIEAFIVKGLVAVSHWVAAHSSSAVVLKGGALVSKSVVTNGLASTASAVAGGAIVTGFAVGGIVWANELLQLLLGAVADLGNGDQKQALLKFSKLYKKLYKELHVGIEIFPDKILH